MDEILTQPGLKSMAKALSEGQINHVVSFSQAPCCHVNRNVAILAWRDN